MDMSAEIVASKTAASEKVVKVEKTVTSGHK